jgi:hypothetical protein
MARPAKPNVKRDATGKSRGEEPEDIMATALRHRLKQGIPYESLVVRDERGKVTHSDAFAGYTLGRLRQAGKQHGISMAQFNTGDNYAKLIRNFNAIYEVPSYSAKSPHFESVSRGTVRRPDADEEWVAEIKGKFNDCYNTLIQTGVDLKNGIGVHGRRYNGTEVAVWTYDACLDRKPFVAFGPEEIGLVRMGLNSLGRWFK